MTKVYKNLSFFPWEMVKVVKLKCYISKYIQIKIFYAKLMFYLLCLLTLIMGKRKQRINLG